MRTLLFVLDRIHQSPCGCPRRQLPTRCRIETYVVIISTVASLLRMQAHLQYNTFEYNGTLGETEGERERERANLKESNGRLNMLRVQLKYATPDRKWQCLPMPTDELLPEYAGDDVGLWSWCWCCCCYWWWWCWANDVHSLKHSLVSPTHTHWLCPLPLKCKFVPRLNRPFDIRMHFKVLLNNSTVH